MRGRILCVLLLCLFALPALSQEAQPAPSLPEEATLIGGTVYVYRQVLLQSADDLSPATLTRGEKLTLLGVQGDTAHVQLPDRQGTIPANALAVDEDLNYVLDMPGDSNLELEKRLEHLGYLDSTPDDLFNFETAQAVVRFRGQAGMDPVFSMDEDFLSRLFDENAPASQIGSVSIVIGDKTSWAARLQNRLFHLGYYDAPLTGRFDSLTCQALMLFQQISQLEETGLADEATLQLLFSPHAQRLPRNLMAASDDTKKYLPGGVVLADWWEEEGVETIFARETVAQITDLASGLSWQVMRRGGSSHADVQPLTAQDTQIFAQAVGDIWSWQRRPIWVTVEGMRYAASMNCMPHGGGLIADNNYPGHHCVHFLNSRTHGGNRVDERHKLCVELAASLDYTTLDTVDWETFFAEDPNTPIYGD